MSDDAKDNKTEDEDPGFHDTSKVAFCQNMGLLQKDLGLLYLKGNASARNKFGDIHPDIAHYLFGEDLIQYDHDGCNDLEHRNKLEEEALQRRFEILKVMDELKDESVEAGSLKMDYVGKVIDHFGADVCRYMYAENIIERVRPGLLKAADEAKENENDGDDESKHHHTLEQENLDDNTILQAAEQEILASKPKDTAVPLPTMDEEEEQNKSSGPAAINIEDELGDIKPIDMRNDNEGEQSPKDGSENVARQSIEIGEGKEQNAAESPAEGTPDDKPPQAPPLPPAAPDVKTEKPEESKSDAPNPAPPLKPEKAPDTEKSSLGPPLKDGKKTEAPPSGKKPDFMSIKVTGEPKPEEEPQKSYKEMFNSLAATVA